MKKLIVVGLLASGSCVYANETEAPGIAVQNKEDVLAKFGELSLTRDAAVATHKQVKLQLEAAQREFKQKQQEWEQQNKAATAAALVKADAAQKVKELEKEEAKAHQESRQARRFRNAGVNHYNTAVKAYNSECWTYLTTRSLTEEEVVSEDEAGEVKPAQEKQEEKINPAEEKQETYAKKASRRSKANQTHNK